MNRRQQTPDPDQLLYTDVQAGQMLGMGRVKLRELTIRGKIRASRIPGMEGLRWHIDDIRAFADQARNAS